VADRDRPGEIFIISLISHRTQKPRVEIKLDDVRTQMSADAAVDVARNLFEVSSGAYADAFLYHFLREKLNQPEQVCVSIIGEFRVYREELLQEFRKEQSREG
jgi:hypothetical protein